MKNISLLFCSAALIVVVLMMIGCATSTSSTTCNSSQGCGLRSYLTDLQQEYDKLDSMSSKLSKAITVLTSANNSALTSQIQTRNKQYQKIVDAQKSLSLEISIIASQCNSYGGDNCDLACFGNSSLSGFVCSGHGLCISIDTCKCNDGWTGSNCSIPTCYNIPATNSSVCSGHGKCISNNTCLCENGVLGTTCNATILISGDDTSGRKYADGYIAKSCLEYRYPTNGYYYYFGNIGSGYYWVKPDATAYKVHCEMVINGGGLTAMTSEIETTSLNTASRSRFYYYVKDSNVWYKSPSSTNVWRWGSYSQLTGDYSYTLNNGQNMSSFTCVGSAEGGIGVGCSEGPNNTKKMVVINHTTEHYCSGCQNTPDAFGAGNCLLNTRIYIM